MNTLKPNDEIMDVFFLGAGKPKVGKKPSSLKEMGMTKCALDWQLHSLESIGATKIHFLGGYHIEEVIKRYPYLHYTIVTGWESKPMLHTLFQAALRKVPTLITYADTIFRKEEITKIAESNADVTLLCDSNWKQRYKAREKEDCLSSEVISLVDGEYCGHSSNASGCRTDVEFTGLVKFSPSITEFVGTLEESRVGLSLLDLIDHLYHLPTLSHRNFEFKVVDVNGDWAEFNSPCDVAHFILGTKAETLSRLAPLVTSCHIGEQVSFTVSDWRKNKNGIISRINGVFLRKPLIIRSSAKGEDSWAFSNAGSYDSILNVDGNSNDAIENAVENVITSYGEACLKSVDQVLVQAFVEDVQCSGVIFTCSLETGAPYYRINFDDKSGLTDSVTSGTHDDFRTILISREGSNYLSTVEPKLLPVLTAAKELEELLSFDKLDIEFARDKNGVVYIFQVRPITIDHSQFEVEKNIINTSIQNAVKNFGRLQAKTPSTLGSRTFFGNMSDWNPAEIIGIRPKPLAFSLYRFLITDEVWARQRAEFGYRDVRPHPLIVDYCGQPYVDIRASLNSFVPAQLRSQLAEKVIESYLRILQDSPQLHDKLEFDVAFTIWTPSFESEALKRLTPYGISSLQIREVGEALQNITRRAISRLDEDIRPVQSLNKRWELLRTSSLSPIDKAIALLSDCKRFGALAFAHAARAGFVAQSFLKSFTTLGILTEADNQAFLKSIKTVASELEEDRRTMFNGQMSKEEYLERYGHLRPGTYDATVEAYWEAPERYLFYKQENFSHNSKEESSFKFSSSARKAIENEIAKIDREILFDSLLEYIVNAIQAREYVKFQFTRNLSLALDAIIEHGFNLGIAREDIIFLNIDEFERLKIGSLSEKDLQGVIEQRKRNFSITQMIELPQLLFQESDFYCFERCVSQPNFVTGKRVEADVILWAENESSDICGRLILIPQADPGYDWLFGHSIAGLITKYGGANSHMAIRAAEMGLPAAIGIGEKLYEQLVDAQRIQLDCANQTIRRI